MRGEGQLAEKPGLVLKVTSKILVFTFRTMQRSLTVCYKEYILQRTKVNEGDYSSFPSVTRLYHSCPSHPELFYFCALLLEPPQPILHSSTSLFFGLILVALCLSLVKASNLFPNTSCSASRCSPHTQSPYDLRVLAWYTIPGWMACCGGCKNPQPRYGSENSDSWVLFICPVPASWEKQLW